ncbi:MAG: hypothetical protein AAF399_13495 [Bacteroidota bacterium]
MDHFLSIIAILLSTRISTTFVHEMGHALAGMILFGGDFDIYIGSFGQSKKGLSIRLGRLRFYIKYDPFLWNHGVVMSSKTEHISWLRNFMFILGGPLASLVLAVTCLIFIQSNSVELFTFVWWLLAVLIVSAFWDFIINLKPNPYPIILHGGSITYNDGQSLRNLLRIRPIYEDFILLGEYYQEGGITKVIHEIRELYNQKKHPDLLRQGIAYYLWEKNYEKVEEMYKELQEVSTLSSDDLCGYGYVLSLTGRHAEAMEFYNQSIKIQPYHFVSLNNRGYELNLLEQYEQAIYDFNLVIYVNPYFAHAYNNRGLAKIKLGNLEEGLEDIKRSEELDPDNSYLYKNLGIYFLEKGDETQAMENFHKARELDPETYGLTELVEELEGKVHDHGD